MVVTIPSSASSTAFPSSREKTRGSSCAHGRRSRVIALSVCLRDSARSARGFRAEAAVLRRALPFGASASAGPCTFGTHLRVLQSFLRPRFAYAALVLLRRCGRAALPHRASATAFRRPHRNIDSATIRPDAASINNYFAQRYALPPQCSVAPAKGGVLAVVARCLRTGSGRGARVRLGRRKRQSQGKRSP